MITGIVVALPEELATITSKRIDKAHCVFISDKVMVAYSGVGAKNATGTAELLVSKGATQLMSWGCAAALSPHLKPGDLVLANRLLDFNDDDFGINPFWHTHAQKLFAKQLNVNSGCLTESLNIISSSREKQHLQLITEAIALDMESIPVAKVAIKHALPFLSVRAIVDPADMDLPRAVAHATTKEGEVALGRLLLFLAFHPLELPGLIRLGVYFNAASKTLKKVAKQLDALVNFN